MKKLTNLIKNTDTKKIIGLSVATAVGAAYGVKTVAKKRKQDLANSNAKQKVTEVLSSTVAAGAKVVGGLREDLSTVIGSAKEKSCAARCAHCKEKDTFKPCCKDGEPCKVKNSQEDAPSEPVKADEVVAAQEEADALAEKLKNDVLKAEKRAASNETKKKATTPRAAKANAKPVSVKEDGAVDKELGVGKIELDDISGTENESETVEKSEEK
jgi:hypothetical protein